MNYHEYHNIEVYLPNRVHLEKFGSLIRDTHLKVRGQLHLYTGVLRSNECLVSIFVGFPGMQDLRRRSNSPIRKGRSLEPRDSETKIINQLRWISGFKGVHAVAMQLFRNPNKSFQLYFDHGTLLFQEAKIYSNITIRK